MTQESGQDAQAGKTRRRWLWITLYVVGLLLLLEAGARLTWRVIDTSWGLVVPQDVSRFDPVYGWSLKPGACSVSKATGRPVEYKINSHGLRGPEIAYDKPAGTSRIVLLGDSHAFGFGVPESYHFASLLEGYLPGVQVVNLGVNGYGIAQELLYLTREGFKYHPDLVIAYVPHYADWRHLRDMVWGMGKPLYRLESGKLVLTNCPVTNNRPLHVAALDLDRVLSHWSRAYQLLRDTVLHFIVTREQLVGRKQPAAQANPAPSAPQAAAAKTPPPADPSTDPRFVEAERVGEAIVDAMVAACAQHGARFLLVTRVPPLARYAEANGIPCLVIGAPLNNHRLALPHDPTRHPNEAANGIIAWSIADFLGSHDLLPHQP